MFADSHAHLSMAAFEGDLADALERARQAGVTRIMTCATSMADARANLQIAQGHGLMASAGFHPHQAKHLDAAALAELEALLDASAGIAAVGEVGLDFHYDYSPRDVQVEAFRSQIRLARRFGLPLIVHCRNAREQLRRLLVEEGAGETGGVLHCFSEDAEFAGVCLDLGFYISFSGIVTFGTAGAIREAARTVPLDRLLVETDAPYLAPVPYRGRRNEPAHVVQTARFVAGLRGVPIEAIAQATSRNFDTLFGRRTA
ncbi:MAG TPA: TatD family hydrolase [Candidatus Polarisedimenticolia bacterium]|nr:TatD family hydrolase [Candidatus Polarisedimenticolia bacterium]